MLINWDDLSHNTQEGRITGQLYDQSVMVLGMVANQKVLLADVSMLNWTDGLFKND